MCWEAMQAYPRDPATPTNARTFTAETLGQVLGDLPHRQLLDDARLVVSELVTNAMNAAATVADLHITLHRDHLTLSVGDNAEGAPRLQQAEITDEHGRGLAIVAAIAQKWGVRDTGSGKEVWADLPVPAELTRQIVCNLI